MQIWDQIDSRPGPVDTRNVLDDLRLLFSGSWRERKEVALPLIAALAADQNILRAFVRTHLEAGAWPALNGAQSFLVHSSPSVLVRLNLWFPPEGSSATNENYRRYLSIEELHNHEFSFFTACLLGPGYSSDFFRDPNDHPGRRRGDAVMLQDVGNHQLAPGRIMFVERNVDYHSQRWPSAFSVTLNVIPRDYENGHRVQYILDRDHIVKTVINTAAAA